MRMNLMRMESNTPEVIGAADKAIQGLALAHYASDDKKICEV
jgi:hypothetical protein